MIIRVVIAEALSVAVIPLNCSKWTLLAFKTTQALDFDWVLEVSDIVIHIDGTFRGTKQDGATIRRPLDKFKLNSEFFSPKTRALDGTDDNCSILVDDTDFLSIRCPLHVSDHTLVAIVDHLFEPVLLVHHPHNNETLLITSRQLLVSVIPLDHLDLT